MLKLVINASVKTAEFIEDFLIEQGALAVSLQDGGDQPLFQRVLHETPLWENTQIHALFEEDVALRGIVQNLEAALKLSLDYRIETVPQEDWVQKTQQNFPARCFADRLWVAPAWQTVLRIHPGLGFGTGAHPTTSLCLEWLAQQNLTDKTVIDYGCGSGILGLAALALGAKKVWAVDYDPQALTATRNNAELNGMVGGALEIVAPEQLPELQAEIILANILANPLCELAPELMRRLASRGQLVLSGFLVEEIDAVVGAYHPTLQPVDIKIQENWVRLVFCKEKNDEMCRAP